MHPAHLRLCSAHSLCFELLAVELEYRTGTQSLLSTLDLPCCPAVGHGLGHRFAGWQSLVQPVLDHVPNAGGDGVDGLVVSVLSRSPAPVWGRKVSVVGRVVMPDSTQLPMEGLAWIRNGWQSWSFCGLLPASNPVFPLPARDFAYRIKEDADISRAQAPFVSDMVGGVRAGEAALFFGSGDQRFFQNVVYGHRDGLLTVRLEVDLDDAPIPVDGQLLAGSWQLEAGQSLTELAVRWAQRKRVPRRTRGNLMAWCSWYQRGPNISLEYVKQTLSVIKDRDELRGISLVQVDDGYQNRVGDWLEPKPSYGADLLETARTIRAAGFQAGLWVAPFVAQQRSRLFRQHPEWFLKRDNDFYNAGWNPFWLDTIRALDTSHPEVLEWLACLFRTLVSYGFTFFKLDYLYPAAIRSRRHDPGVGRFQAFRQGLEAISKAAGPGVTLLGCGAPLAPSVGLVDAMRVSVDIDTRWQNPGWLRMATGDTETTGLGPAVRNSLTRGPFCGPLYRVDPDCLLLRQKGSSLNAEELETAGWLAAMHGEWVLLGDDLTKWTEVEFQRLRDVLPNISTQAMPLDSLDSPLPTWTLAKQGNRDVLVGVNLAPHADSIQVPLSVPVVPRGPWSALSHGDISVTPQWLSWANVPAHGVRVAVTRPGSGQGEESV